MKNKKLLVAKKAGKRAMRYMQKVYGEKMDFTSFVIRNCATPSQAYPDIHGVSKDGTKGFYLAYTDSIVGKYCRLAK